MLNVFSNLADENNKYTEKKELFIEQIKFISNTSAILKLRADKQLTGKQKTT